MSNLRIQNIARVMTTLGASSSTLFPYLGGKAQSLAPQAALATITYNGKKLTLTLLDLDNTKQCTFAKEINIPEIVGKKLPVSDSQAVPDSSQRVKRFCTGPTKWSNTKAGDGSGIDTWGVLRTARSAVQNRRKMAVPHEAQGLWNRSNLLRFVPFLRRLLPDAENPADHCAIFPACHTGKRLDG